MKYYRKDSHSEAYTKISWYVIIGSFALIAWFTFFPTDSYVKEKILANLNLITISDEVNRETTRFHMEAPIDYYYQRVTITRHTDQVTLVFWGDRESFFWYTRGDKVVDIFRSSRNIKDKKIILFLDNKILQDKI
jgi:hypothetical protein